MANSVERARHPAHWATGPRPGMPVLEPAAARTLPSDWSLIVTHGVNALIEGDDELTQAMVRALKPCLRAPVRSWGRGSLTESTATLLVEDVGGLSVEAQNALFEWLSVGNAPRRVIATSPRPLFPIVERGQFRGDLYYHLNIILLQLR
jgi:sigma-54 interacting transcriptional regulator